MESIDPDQDSTQAGGGWTAARRARWGAGAVLALLVVAELALRGLGYGYRARMRTSERVGIELLPSQTVLMPHSEIPLRVNGHGFRGDEWGPPELDAEGRPTGSSDLLRVAVVGHSVTIGGWEEEHETFCGVLERLLDDELARRGDDRRALVMNFAGPAHTLAGMHATFEDRVRPFRPDYLVVPSLAVDVRPMHPGGDAPERFLRGLYVRSALYDWYARLVDESPIDQPRLSEREARRWNQVDALVDDIQADPFDRDHRDLWDRMYTRLEAMRALQAEDGGRTVLLSLVDPRDLVPPSASWTRIGELHARWGQGRDALLLVDPRPAFEGVMAPLLEELAGLGLAPQEVLAKYRSDPELELRHRANSPFLFFSPAHYTRLGHRLVGEALFEAIAADLASRAAGG